MSSAVKKCIFLSHIFHTGFAFKLKRNGNHKKNEVITASKTRINLFLSRGHLEVCVSQPPERTASLPSRLQATGARGGAHSTAEDDAEEVRCVFCGRGRTAEPTVMPVQSRVRETAVTYDPPHTHTHPPPADRDSAFSYVAGNGPKWASQPIMPWDRIHHMAPTAEERKEGELRENKGGIQ